MRNLVNWWMAANPIARVATYAVVGIVLGLVLRVVA